MYVCYVRVDVCVGKLCVYDLIMRVLFMYVVLWMYVCYVFMYVRC